MDEPGDSLETLWDGLLSRQPEQVRAAYASLDEMGKKAVLAHLERMANEAGWHPEQRFSAQVALEALKRATYDGS
ncbi:MAG TPA: hypothetical protein VI755_08420 [Anaerolineales bacterium]|nr:hypothetical protein [Anaerolineales bacterium]